MGRGFPKFAFTLTYICLELTNAHTCVILRPLGKYCYGKSLLSSPLLSFSTLAGVVGVGCRSEVETERGEKGKGGLVELFFLSLYFSLPFHEPRIGRGRSLSLSILLFAAAAGFRCPLICSGAPEQDWRRRREGVCVSAPVLFFSCVHCIVPRHPSVRPSEEEDGNHVGLRQQIPPPPGERAAWKRRGLPSGCEVVHC